MIKYIFIFFLLYGCSNIEFVYNTKIKTNEKKDVSIRVGGSNNNIALSHLINIFNSNNEADLSLKLIIAEEITAQKTELDSIVSKYQIKHTIDYNFFNHKKKCNILNQQKITFSSYDSKSGGYSFGSDASKKETIKNNIQKNINSFLDNLNKKNPNFICLNENKS